MHENLGLEIELILMYLRSLTKLIIMNKLIYPLLSVVIITVSCKKDDKNNLEAGETKGMNVTSHNLSAKANFTDTDPEKTIEVDLDENGQPDIRFRSFQDSLLPQLCGIYSDAELEALEFEGTMFPVSSISLELLNGSFQIAVYENSNMAYEIHSDEYEVHRPDGSTAIMQKITTTKREPSNFQQNWDDLNTVQSFNENELIPESQLFLNPENLIHMCYSSFENTFYYKDTIMDVTRGQVTYRERNYLEVPANELRYLMFKKSDKWGWISFKITEENRITILESAISK